MGLKRLLSGIGLSLVLLGGLVLQPEANPTAAQHQANLSENQHLNQNRPLRFSPQVKDPALSLIVGLVQQNRFGTFTSDEFARRLQQSGRASKVPVELLASFTRTPLQGRRPVASMSLTMSEGGDIPIPYDILGYHPGTLRTSKDLELVEYYLGDIKFTIPKGGRYGGKEVVDLRNIRLWGVKRGNAEMDVDGWLDALMGSKLDDTAISGFALFHHNGQLIAMAMGYSKSGKGHSGAFDLRRDKILFPHPKVYKATGAMLRGKLERLMPATKMRRAHKQT
ncbi:MAG: hypothetical protein HKN21_05520 [Candidatus Eisenbacteria bacterium]|uniref:Uncharacterized protein n=1 Tax=Eiseniibacteriota bacterium TaxID=2212470 RepID=A0A7Y2H1M7_UNCEI|nr:hypothetical protein [Candidatus Eisenbacteria bacterium]